MEVTKRMDRKEVMGKTQFGMNQTCDEWSVSEAARMNEERRKNRLLGLKAKRVEVRQTKRQVWIAEVSD